jgi:phosphoglycerate dehydrogenase-like enzyme
MARIAVLDDYQGVARRYGDWGRLEAAGHELTVFQEHLGDLDAVTTALEPFEIVCSMRERTPFPAELLERLPRLELLVTTAMVNRSIDVGAAAARGVTVCGTRYRGGATEEHTWALILALARHIPEEDAGMRTGGWQTTVGVGLHGKTLGILGLGRLGSAAARVGSAFGMRCIAWSQNLTHERAAEAGAELVSKDELFRQADVLTIHLVLSKRTRGLVGPAELALMKATALLVNTSRGPIVDEAALVAALAGGTIGGAAIDVFDEEPLPRDHPLRSAQRTVITPHLGFVTDDLYETFFTDTVANIEAFLAGSPVRVMDS